MNRTYIYIMLVLLSGLCLATTAQGDAAIMFNTYGICAQTLLVLAFPLLLMEIGEVINRKLYLVVLIIATLILAYAVVALVISIFIAVISGVL